MGFGREGRSQRRWLGGEEDGDRETGIGCMCERLFVVTRSFSCSSYSSDVMGKLGIRFLSHLSAASSAILCIS